jgi:hypothetical protein
VRIDQPRFLAGLPVSGINPRSAPRIPVGDSWAINAHPWAPMRISRIRWRAMAPGLLLQDLRVAHWSIQGGPSAGIHLELSGVWRFPAVDVFAGGALSALIENVSPQPVQLIEFVWWGRPLQTR